MAAAIQLGTRKQVFFGPWASDTQYSVFWDEHLGRYVPYSRAKRQDPAQDAHYRSVYPEYTPQTGRPNVLYVGRAGSAFGSTGAAARTWATWPAASCACASACATPGSSPSSSSRRRAGAAPEWASPVGGAFPFRRPRRCQPHISPEEHTP